MMNMNPMQLMQLIQGGGNPMQTIMGLAKQNPQLQQVMQMVNGQTPAQMRDTAMTLAKQRGVDINQIAQQLGIKLPL